MPLEYAYFQPTENVDWAKLTGDLSEKIKQIGEDRNAKRAELDKMYKDASDLISSTDIKGPQTFKDIMFDGVSKARNKASEWTRMLKTGQMKPDEFKAKMNSLTDNWNNVIDLSKNLDSIYQSILERQKPDENGNIAASDMETAAAQRLGMLAELSNKKFEFDDNGSVFAASFDDNGNVNQLEDIRILTKPENLQFNRLNVDQRVADVMKNFGEWQTWKSLGGGGERTVKSIMENPAYKNMVGLTIQSLTSNPRDAASVLVDNGVINPLYYFNEDEKKKLITDQENNLKQAKQLAGLDTKLTDQDKKSIENNLIQMSIGRDGILNPVLTKSQLELAQDRVRKSLEMQTEKIVTGNAPSYSSSGTTTEKPLDTSLYESWLYNWKNADENKLTSLLKDSYKKLGYQVRRTNEGTSIVKVTRGRDGETVEEIVKPTKNGEDVQNFFFSDSDIAKIQRQRKEFISKGGLSTTVKFN